MRKLDEFGFGLDPADEQTQRLPAIQDTGEADLHAQRPTYQERPHATRASSDLIVRKLQQTVSYIFGVVATILALRVILVAIGANPDNPFFVLLRELSDPLVAPFANIVATPRVNGVTIETTTIFAIIIYLLVRQALVRLLDLFILHEEAQR